MTKQALIDLRDAVREGIWSGDLGIFSHREHLLSFQSFEGSLDAFVQLLEAVLPGWEARLWTTGFATVIHPTNRTKDREGRDKIPARAGLLAILEALIHEGGDDE